MPALTSPQRAITQAAERDATNSANPQVSKNEDGVVNALVLHS